MKYRVTCLTPTLVGDGQRLAPIDYMVWKDQVNILDQRRIFRLLAKGPRLDGYLNQLKKSEKLDFASWGGFAQNFAGRRIPFEHPSLTQYWERARAENLFIPTFASGLNGPFLPASALKGALRTGAVFADWSRRGTDEFASRIDSSDPRALRRAAASAEDAALGPSGSNLMRLFGAADSGAVSHAQLRVYLLRVSTLEARGAGRFELAWKTAGRTAARKPEDATPAFAEMAVPGTEFEGEWSENAFLASPEINQALRRRQPPSRASVFAAVNAWSARQLALHKQYAQWTGLARLAASVEALEARLESLAGAACLVPLGWGGGFLSKASFLETQDAALRGVLKQFPLYARAIQSGLPFPKTRRIVFENNQPATIPGWTLVEVLP